MGTATRVIRDEATGQLVRVPAWQAAPDRMRASSGASKPNPEATPCAGHQTVQAPQRGGSSRSWPSLPALFSLFFKGA